MNGFTILTPGQVRALEALATYRVLTIDLMRRLGVGSDPKHLRESLAVLIAKGMVGRTDSPPFLPGVGRQPHLYWLMAKGVAALGDLSEATAPNPGVGRVTVTNELPHLLGIVAAHVECRLWAERTGARVEWFRADFERGGGELQKRTVIPYREGAKRYTPDAIGCLRLPDDPRPALLVFEVYRGGRKGSLSHFRSKLDELGEVARDAVVERHHGAARAVRFLVVFADAGMRDRALRSWPDADAPLWAARFFVKSLDELADFGGNWLRPSGVAVSLF